MINKLTKRHTYDTVEDFFQYTIQCPCCGTILNFGREDVYTDEDEILIHHEYIDCPECNENIKLNDEKSFGY